MSKLKSILLLTPNTDTFTNPTLVTLFRFLESKQISVYLFAPKQDLVFPENVKNVFIHTIDLKLSVWRNPKYFIKQVISYYSIYKLIKKEKIQTILAVDPLGLIWGARIKRFLLKNVHLSYLSFEIFFKNELSGYYKSLKNKEICYSSYIDSLLIQDEKRKELLLKENKIYLNNGRIALLPVSPMKIEIKEKINVYNKLGIDSNKKLVVYSGSIGKWCGTDVIIDFFEKGYWNNIYHLVFHTRTKINNDNPYYQKLKDLHDNNNIPFTLHAAPFDSFEKLSVFLSGFDLALALYYPNNENPYYGMNMQEIGLSSGKFSTYMMLGLPTIVTPCRMYEELLRKYRFGAILKEEDEISSVLTLNFNKEEIGNLYNEVLKPDFDTFLKMIRI